MKRLRFINVATLALTLLTVAYGTPLQQQSQPVTSRLALEVTYYSGRPPTYQTVPPAGSEPGGSWYGMFRRIDSWKGQPGALPAEAVRVTSKLEADQVSVFVSTLSGEKALENEVPVTKFIIRENQKVTVEELKQFGIEPFEIKLVRVAYTPLAIPTIDNRVGSLVIVNTEVANDSTLPTYKLTLVSHAGKTIIALGIDVLVDGKVGLTGIHQNPEGQVFIIPEKTYQLKVAAVRRAQTGANGYSPGSPPNQKILIKSAVFEDGTYEGEAEVAAIVMSHRAGEKMVILKLIPLLTDAINAADTNFPEGLKKLEAQVSMLSTDAEPKAVQSLMTEFPQVKQSATFDAKRAIEFGAETTKRNLLKDLGKLEADSQSLDANTYRELLGRAKERYEKWLAGL
jgi:hypothetical protein